jgi:hypothetical protein
MPTTDEDSVNSFDTEDRDRRRNEAYKLYKRYAKPRRASMCKIVDYHAKDTGITRQDVDLLPWNPEKTEVIKAAMLSPKKKKKEEEKENKENKKETFAKSKGDNKRPALLKEQTGYSSTSLDISWNDITGSVDISSTIWDLDHTQDDNVSAEQIQTIKVEEQHRRKREERRLKRDEVTKKNFSEVEEQGRLTAEEIRREDTRNQIVKARLDDRLERTFLWFTRMGTPTRKEFKQQIAIQKVDITPEDVDLLAWNESGTRVKNIATMNAMLIRTRMLKQ